MAKRIMQFRYYNENNEKNYPSNISKSNLVNGSAFNGYNSITQLGIQCLPGTKFYLNDSDASTPIIIGSTGIYELDLEGLSEISEIKFDVNSLDRVIENDSAYLIVDIVYNQGG